MKLLEPLAIGSHEAPSRVIFGPHETNLARRRAISDRHVAYYRRRAAGGAGLIITEEASVHESDWPYERAPLATDCASGWEAVTAACHEEGSLVLAALGHAGGQGTSHWSQRELWAPSRVPEVNLREVPKWMEAEDIAAVVGGFALAARIAVDAGCDGVEINAGQFSLIRQFLSGLTNHRGDEWGADKFLLLSQVLAAVRAAIGGDAVIGLRLSCDELAPWAGITPEQAPELAAAIVSSEQASVDLLTVVRGSIYTSSAYRPDGHTLPGFNLTLAGKVAEAVRSASGGSVKVVAQGSIVDVGQAEWALDEGLVDGIEMTRAQIFDADLVAKSRAGQSERIRPCTLANQRSQVRDNRNPIVTSSGDPYSGHETEDPSPNRPTKNPVDVTVVGGGPAGLEAARVAASNGHRVRLLEASSRLGGAVRVAANMPGFDRLALLVDWLESECRLEGVELTTDSEVSAAAIIEDHAKRHVIIAAGSRGQVRGYETTKAAKVWSASEVLADPDGLPAQLPTGPVLIWDPIGGSVGVGVAELLASIGTPGGDSREVHLATPDNVVGNELARSGDLAPANVRLAQHGVNLHRRSILRAVRKSSVTLEDKFTGETRSLKAAMVVDCGFWLPDETLWNSLKAAGLAGLTRVGDCVAPRTIHDAILEGRRAALALD